MQHLCDMMEFSGVVVSKQRAQEAEGGIGVLLLRGGCAWGGGGVVVCVLRCVLLLCVLLACLFLRLLHLRPELA